MIQLIVTGILVLAAGYFLFRRAYGSIKPKKSCGSSCPACGELGKEKS